MRLTTRPILDGALPQHEEAANRIADHLAAIDGLASAVGSVHPPLLRTFRQPLHDRPKNVAHDEQQGEKL